VQQGACALGKGRLGYWRLGGERAIRDKIAPAMTEAELKAHLAAAERSSKEIAAAVSGLPPELLPYKPAPEKWSILEILAHLADMEALYACRIRQMLADKQPVIAPIEQGRHVLLIDIAFNQSLQNTPRTLSPDRVPLR
jgi:DinB superfamily